MPARVAGPALGRAGRQGKTDAVSYYMCESRGRRFSREDGRRIMAEAAERVRLAEEEPAQPSQG